MVKLRRMVGALVAVAIGIALVMLALLLLLAGRPIVPERLAAAAVVVDALDSHSPAESFTPTVPWSSARAEELSRDLGGLPGVEAVVADRTFYVQALVGGRPPAVEGQRQDTYEGHGWSSARLGGLALVAGEPPRRAGEVVVDRALGLRPGSAVTLLMATGPVPYTVTGLVDAPGYLVADDVAARLAPGVRAIGLVLEPDADPGTVAAAARGVVGSDGRVLTGDERGALEPRDDARARWIGMQALTGVATLAGFVTVFVVASTFAFTVAQRRRELGLLRAVGATPRQVRRMVYGEALLVGCTGAVLGVVVGAALAPLVGRALIGAGLEPATYEVRYGPVPFLVALALGPVVALLGAWSAARRAARVRPLEALREAAVERRPMGRLRWIVGGSLVLLGVGFAIGTATADDAQDGATLALYSAMALVTGMVGLAPAAVPPIVGLWRLPFRRGGGAIGLLVREGALTAARRTASTAAPVLLTVAFAVLVAGMVQTTTAAYAAGRAADVDAGQVMVPDRTPGLSDAAVAAVPGSAMLPTTAFGRDDAAGADRRAWNVLGVDPAAFAEVDRGARVLAGSLGDLQGQDSPAETGANQSGAEGDGAVGVPGAGQPGVGGEDAGAGPPGIGGEDAAAGQPGVGGEDAGAGPPGIGGEDAAAGQPGVGGEDAAAGPPGIGGEDAAAGQPGVGGEDPAAETGPERRGVGDEYPVVVTESVRRGVGDVYPVVFADGERVSLRVVAVVADRSVRADLLLSRVVVRRHDPSALTSAVYLPGVKDSGASASPGTGSGASPGTGAGASPGAGSGASPGAEARVVVPVGAGARVIDVATWAAEADSAEDRLVWLFTLMLIGVSGGYGAIAVANTLLMAAQGRAADLRVMRLAGATRRQVAGYVAAESALVVLIGAVLGGAVAFGALISIRAGLSQQVGAAVALVVPWSVIAGVVGLCLVLALLAGVLPTRRMLRERAIRMSS
ncbi:FtsX-like permease family protein [Dactylosporangium sp. CS-033363]|uniref:FtsX-like permease family protein n=1 Tax=Dactylosporangium sp. CS-033363 TaxID=3239935 RepID=UPI003D901DCF